jgi:threonine/homoserine/homoserine lactone efflux protein
MPESNATIALSLLSAMITPALLISACGTLIFSTSARLARIVDRVRMLARQVEELCERPQEDPGREQMAEIERQLATSAERTRLVQGSLTSFYVALGLFVATTVSIGGTRLLGRAEWLPAALGVAGTLVLFWGSVLLIRETRLALGSVRREMEVVLQRSRRGRR